MSFVLFDETTGALISTQVYVSPKKANRAAVVYIKRLLARSFDHESRGAKMFAKDLVKEARHIADNWSVASLDAYNLHHRKTKVVRNLMSGKEITIDINTPMCCDPSSETYWSM